MCKITAVNVGMCLPKCIFIIVNLFTFVLGFAIAGVSIYGLTAIRSMIENSNFDFIFYGPIAFGCIILFISSFGCCGAFLKNRCMLMTFAILLFVIFILQIGVASVVYYVVIQLNKSVENVLKDTLMATKTNEIYLDIWELTQYFFHCCGVTAPSDWNGIHDTIPKSCCPIPTDNTTTTCVQENAYERGCKTFVSDYLIDFINPAMVAVAVILLIQLFNLVFSCCMFCVYGRKSRNKKRESFPAIHNTSQDIASNSEARLLNLIE